MNRIIYFLLVAFIVQTTCSWFGSSETDTGTTTTTVAPESEKNEEVTTTTTVSPESEKNEEVTTTTTVSPESETTSKADETVEGQDKLDEEKDLTEGEPMLEEEYLGDEEENPLDNVDFYMYSVYDLAGEVFALEAYRGYVTLVVNVASKCGYTDSTYKDLVNLQNKFEPTGVFTVLAFPSNQFWEQEPGTNEEILKFATETYNANFPIFGKTEVAGDNATDAWQYLAYSTGYAPQWNFWKYLVDQNGHVIDVWSHETAAAELEGWIDDAVNKAIAQAEGTFTGEEDYQDGFYEESHDYHEEL